MSREPGHRPRGSETLISSLPVFTGSSSPRLALTPADSLVFPPPHSTFPTPEAPSSQDLPPPRFLLFVSAPVPALQVTSTQTPAAWLQPRPPCRVERPQLLPRLAQRTPLPGMLLPQTRHHGQERWLHPRSQGPRFPRVRSQLEE